MVNCGKTKVNTMKIFKIMLALLMIGIMTVPIIGCSSDAEAEGEIEAQEVTVEKGDLTVEITSSGNLALSLTEDLAFEVAGTVEEVFVDEGDIVEEGQVLSSLDEDEWDDNLETLQDRLTAAERALTTKERALTTAERNVIDAERNIIDKENGLTSANIQVTAKELAERQAEIDLQTAEYNLNDIDEVEEIQDTIDDAEYTIKFAKSMLAGQFGGEATLTNYGYWAQLKANAEDQLAEAQDDLQEILTGSNITISSDVAIAVAGKQLQVELKQTSLESAKLAVNVAQKSAEDAEYALEEAQLDVGDAVEDVDSAKLDVKDAIRAVENARENMDEALATSLEIIAPFDGFVTKVNVEGGDEVMKGTVAVQLADPNKFEADILVSEMDIYQLEVGGQAWVQVDAMQSMTLPAEIVHIAPTATIQSGVVNYKVKVEVQSMEAIQQERQTSMRQTMGNLAQGEIPERLQEAIDSGQMTREQVDEMLAQRQQASVAQAGQVKMDISENYQLKEGLTVTVNIIVDERADVLLVPNGAITSKGSKNYVTISGESGNELCVVETGISDWQFTEIISGLEEGDLIFVNQGTVNSSSTSSSNQKPSPPKGIVPGMGKMMK